MAAMKKAAPKPKTPAKKTAAKSKAPANQHLKELKAESKRVKGLYDPTARPGFQFGKGTI